MHVRRILWAALLGSTFIYLVILQLVAIDRSQTPDPTMAIAFAVVSCTTIGAAFFLPTTMLKQGLASKDFAVTTAETFRDEPAGTRYFANPDQARAQAAGSLQTGFIVRMALFESIALYGVVLGFMNHPLPFVLGFFGVAWLLMALQFPTQAGDDRTLTAATGIRFR